MRSYPVKENHICSAVSEIFWYKQTDRQTDILLLYDKDTLVNFEWYISFVYNKYCAIMDVTLIVSNCLVSNNV